MEEIFESKTKQNTPYFSFHGYECYARVVDVYDGDTLTAVFEFKGEFYKFKIRLSNIDTCEIKSKQVEIKNKALEAKKRLLDLIRKGDNGIELNDKVFLVYLKCGKFDKYGRLLCDVLSMEKDINFGEILLNEHLAYQYDGGKKLSEQEQLNDV